MVAGQKKRREKLPPATGISEGSQGFKSSAGAHEREFTTKTISFINAMNSNSPASPNEEHLTIDDHALPEAPRDGKSNNVQQYGGFYFKSVPKPSQ